jgi:hypothetical protein
LQPSAAAIAQALGGKKRGRYYVARCPGHDDRNPSFLIWTEKDGRTAFYCAAGCDWHDIADALADRGLWNWSGDRDRPPAPPRHEPERERDLSKAAHWLWHERSEPLAGTLAEFYLATTRSLPGAFPNSLRFLPPYKHYEPALITAFGSIADVRAVHLTKLTADGRKLEKITVGSPAGLPIIISPPDGSGRLVIVEGIEEGLSIFFATGCQVWAAGSASFMPSLAARVPPLARVSIVTDADPAGDRAYRSLRDGLNRRGIYAHRVAPPGARR